MTHLANDSYFAFSSLVATLFMAFFGMVFGIMTKFSFTRKLLLNNPKFFSLGFFSREGPSEETMENTKFSITFHGQGWPKEEALSESSDQHTTPPSKTLTTRVTATNPGKCPNRSYIVVFSFTELFIDIHRLWSYVCCSGFVCRYNFERER